MGETTKGMEGKRRSETNGNYYCRYLSPSTWTYLWKPILERDMCTHIGIEEEKEGKNKVRGKTVQGRPLEARLSLCFTKNRQR